MGAAGRGGFLCSSGKVKPSSLQYLIPFNREEMFLLRGFPAGQCSWGSRPGTAGTSLLSSRTPFLLSFSSRGCELEGAQGLISLRGTTGPNASWLSLCRHQWGELCGVPGSSSGLLLAVCPSTNRLFPPPTHPFLFLGWTTEGVSKIQPILTAALCQKA